MTYRLTYRNNEFEDIDCDGMQTTERFTLFVRVDKIQEAGDESQQPSG
ncbi:hypothetical protein LCGC14_0674430, partial [marine sediment metagenome]